MASQLKQATKDKIEKLITEPPFPNIGSAAKMLGLTPSTVYSQSLADPEWYDRVRALRDERQMEWLSQIQAEAMAELHEMTAAALDVKREHLKHYFAMSVPMVAEKASDYVLDRVIGKPTERQDVNLKTEGTVTVKHEFDYDAYRALFSESESGDGLPTPEGDGPL